jgi:NADH:ubiquinone oxidoreductase subunit 5 (subunit L)/multisubunit Na+/H+ antiporter MnhA subunit
MLDGIFFVYLLPLLISLFLCLPQRFSEKTITRLSGLGLLIPAITTMGFLLYEAFSGKLPYESELVSLKLYGHEFKLIAWIDSFTIIMLTLTHTLGLLVIKFSHGYLHLEKGYQRFFSTISFFIFGMYLLSLSGTIDMFFAAWEILGFSSFFLIAFYRSSNRSVTNALRVYNIYRVCDVGLLMGAVLGHVLWHHATKFSEIRAMSPDTLQAIPTPFLIVLSLFLIFASLGKSAQFPFHNWPSKAMEGPTPSSAIFYGSLSIHAGVFLLVRTYPIWSFRWEMKAVVFLIGFITFTLSTIQGRIQSNIKAQIAFATTSQIGLMFIEISLGLLHLAMAHLFCHALYRCFQLLVSSSVVASSLTLNNKVTLDRLTNKKRWELLFLPNGIRNTIYFLALNDFSMDTSWRGFNFLPWRLLYQYLKNILSYPFLVVLFVGVLVIFSETKLMGVYVDSSILLSFMSLFFSLRALFVQQDPFLSLVELTLSLTLDILSIYLGDRNSINGIKIFLISVIPASFFGLYVTYFYRGHNLQDYHAEGSDHPTHANIFLVVFMVLSGMPVSSAFFGEDIIIEELIMHSLFMAFSTTMSLMLNGLICVRIYTKLFMGSRSSLLQKRVTAEIKPGRPVSDFLFKWPIRLRIK